MRHTSNDGCAENNVTLFHHSEGNVFPQEEVRVAFSSY